MEEYDMEALLVGASFYEAHTRATRAGWVVPAEALPPVPAAVPGDTLLRKRIALNTL